MVTDAIRVARTAGATGTILVRGDSAYGSSAVAGACLKAGARFSLVLVKNSSLISDAEVAEVATFTAFGSTRHPVTARLIVRRVRDRATTEELFPVWRYHP